MNIDDFRDALDYCPRSGIFTWKKRIAPNAKVGCVAGRNCNGYVQIRAFGLFVLAHRLAWAFVHGEWPKGMIDHINGIRGDNRIGNLRVVDRSVNAQNQRKATAANKEGLLGVSMLNGKYRAQICVSKDGVKKSIHLGRFETAKDAHDAYLHAKRRLHPGCTI